jgi:hypothetical protein
MASVTCCRTSGPAGRCALPRPEVPTPGKNRQVTVFGALEVSTGAFIVPYGEVESFVKTVGDKGPQWVVEVIEKGLIDGAREAQDFVDKVLCAL